MEYKKHIVQQVCNKNKGKLITSFPPK